MADDPDLGPLGEDVDGGLHELPEEDDGDDAVGYHYEHPVSDRDVLLPPSPAGGGDGRAAARYVADGAEQVQDLQAGRPQKTSIVVRIPAGWEAQSISVSQVSYCVHCFSLTIRG